MFENIHFNEDVVSIGELMMQCSHRKYEHPNNILINHYHLIKHAKNFVAAKYQMDNLLLKSDVYNMNFLFQQKTTPAKSYLRRSTKTKVIQKMILTG